MSGLSESTYVGNELELFSHAQNWKRYWRSIILPFLRGDVLEVGAGMGTNTRLLRNEQQLRWVCLEPDARLLEQFRNSLCHNPLAQQCELRQGIVADLPPTEKFDVLIYIDVLEHIPDDATELKRAAAHLNERGRMIVLSPAHAWLFSPFDAAIGHCRRYTKRSLQRAGQSSELQLERLIYLDSCGLFASAGNRLLLRRSMPTLQQILFWDRILVPCSRALDRCFGRKLGKSILGIWQKGPPS
jgi:SAM-dependent methyltransferase